MSTLVINRTLKVASKTAEFRQLCVGYSGEKDRLTLDDAKELAATIIKDDYRGALLIHFDPVDLPNEIGIHLLDLLDDNDYDALIWRGNELPGGQVDTDECLVFFSCLDEFDDDETYSYKETFRELPG